MARPREFDEDTVLDAVVQRFWRRGYEATSVKDLIGVTGIAAASLYNAYGDKRELFRRALDRYVAGSIAARIQRCEELPPRDAIGKFFAEIVSRSLNDPEHKGCMLVNSALELAPHDPEFQKIILGVFSRLENFFFNCIKRGQEAGEIAGAMPAQVLARHLLSTLIGVRVLARVRPDRMLLMDVVRPALALLDHSD